MRVLEDFGLLGWIETNGMHSVGDVFERMDCIP